VVLTLESNKEYRGSIVKGKPVECSQKDCDGRLKHPHCYLNAISIESRRALK